MTELPSGAATLHTILPVTSVTLSLVALPFQLTLTGPRDTLGKTLNPVLGCSGSARSSATLADHGALKYPFPFWPTKTSPLPGPGAPDE
jgi:hypothetical protein